MSQIEKPESWEFPELHTICDVIYRYPTYYEIDYINSGITEIRGELIERDGSITTDSTKYRYISKKTCEKFPKTILKEGDIIMTVRGTIGKVGIIPKNMEGSNITANLMRIAPKPKKCLSRYLQYFFKSKYFLEKISEYSTITAIATIKAPLLKSIKVPLPPIETQKKIIDRLDYFFEILSKKQNEIFEINSKRNISLLVEDMKKHILYSIRLGEYGKNEWETFPKQKLGEMTTITAGGTPSRQNPEYWGGKIPWIKSGELLDSITEDSKEHITTSGLQYSSAKLFPKNTILVALYGQGKTRGRTTKLVKESSTNQACCAILPYSELNPDYLQFWIRSMYWELREQTRTGPQPNWNAKTIKEIEIVIPSLKLQEKIVEDISKKLQILESVRLKTDKILELKKFLIHYFSLMKRQVLNEAFTGRLVK